MSEYCVNCEALAKRVGELEAGFLVYADKVDRESAAENKRLREALGYVVGLHHHKTDAETVKWVNYLKSTLEANDDQEPDKR